MDGFWLNSCLARYPTGEDGNACGWPKTIRLQPFPAELNRI
jgi:hypothetical protein